MARLRRAIKSAAAVAFPAATARTAWRALPYALGLAPAPMPDLALGAAAALLLTLVLAALGLGKAARDRLWALGLLRVVAFVLSAQVRQQGRERQGASLRGKGAHAAVSFVGEGP